jgi:hypothetical protein
MTASETVAVRGHGSVPPQYEHYDKEIVPATRLSLPGTVLKWYDIQRGDAPVPADIRRMARLYLVDETESGALNLRDQLGFVILHRCGEDFYFLCAATWHNNNELWEVVFYKDAGMPGFERFSPQHPQFGTFCVWELGAVCHEQQAFLRFLRSSRNAPAVQANLDDQYAGPV